MKTLLLAVCLLALTGCAGTGGKIEAGKLQELRRGQTTAEAVYKQFGRPDFLSRNMDGTQTAFYIRSMPATDPTPVIGALTASSETVTFYFDAAGVLSDYKYSPPATSRSSVGAAGAAPAAAGGAAAGAGGAASATSSAPASRSDGKPSAPYLWDILRSSTSKDPRNP